MISRNTSTLEHENKEQKIEKLCIRNKKLIHRTIILTAQETHEALQRETSSSTAKQPAISKDDGNEHTYTA
jgi:hypothetical protein